MHHSRSTVLALFLSGILLSPVVVAAAPASYSDIIYAERQKMLRNNPYDRNENQQSGEVRKTIETPTWGQLIKSEHERLMKLYPEADVQIPNKSDTRSNYSNPTNYSDLIKMEKNRMNSSP